MMKLGFQQWPVSLSVEFYIEMAVAAFLFLVSVAAWRFFLTERKGSRFPPGPFPLPVIGNLHLLGELPHRALAALSMKHGPLMSLRFGSALTLVVSSPEMARVFLKTHDHVFANKPPSTATKYLLYNSSDLAFSPYGPYYAQMRKLCVLELLSSRRLDYFSFIRKEEVSAMIRSIINSYDSRPLNISQTVSALASAIICRMAFGRKYSHQELRGLSAMVKESFLLLGSFNMGDYIPYLGWMDLQGFNRRMKKLHKAQDHFLEKVIDQHVAQNEPKITRRDLVDLLLAASGEREREFQLSRDSVKGVVFDMLLAGSDTAPTMIEWAMSEALRNPPVMKKLQDELERVVGLGRMVCESDLPHLVYLQAVVKETLRLHPPGPFLFRYLSTEDCNVLGYEIFHKTRVLINLWAVGRNPKLWEDAENFKPKRFMEGVGSEVDGNEDKKYEWLPFGSGRRRCPGEQWERLLYSLGWGNSCIASTGRFSWMK